MSEQQHERQSDLDRNNHFHVRLLESVSARHSKETRHLARLPFGRVHSAHMIPGYRDLTFTAKIRELAL
jgi:hypothetical protein